MVRQMRDPAFKAKQFAGVHLPHVTEVNQLVESLRQSGLSSGGRGWVPYVAPIHGGTEAHILSILRDPGPMTHESKGSGMLCVENYDDSAALQCELLASVELTPADLTPWNTYPWYRHDQSSGLRSSQITEGLAPLGRLIELMPNLEVVLLQGGEAQTLWKRFTRKHPRIATQYTAVGTYHPGKTALRTPDP
ncbi:uracil-DNA glycosylase [Pseudarthrobacter sp. LMD1-1-1.1]|uniref:uracil-DNA glycosylase n=1 Tax=Pseudarthrobacter sp. LMD1-1-1.1 TaxID=3135242 RepID=UPI003431B02D